MSSSLAFLRIFFVQSSLYTCMTIFDVKKRPAVNKCSSFGEEDNGLFNIEGDMFTTRVVLNMGAS